MKPARMKKSNIKTYRVLNIDAWNSPEGWTWNSWQKAGTVKLDINASDRQIIMAMREQGFLSDWSKGRVAVDDDQYNLVILNKSNQEPVFAIEYGCGPELELED